MFDVSGLVEEKMGKIYNGFRGSFYLDASGVCDGRTCSKCRIAKHRSEFGTHVKNKYGLFNMCYPCSRENSPVSKHTENARKRRKRNKLRTDEEIAKDRRRLRKDGTKRCRSCRLHRLFFEFYNERGETDGMSTRCSNCVKDNTRRYHTKPHLDHWKLKGIPVKCYVCGDIDNLDIDHVIPKSLGGSDEPFNRLPLCEYHNSSKNARTLNKWLLEYFPDMYDEVMHRVIVEYQVWPFVKGHDLVITIDR